MHNSLAHRVLALAATAGAAAALAAWSVDSVSAERGRLIGEESLRDAPTAPPRAPRGARPGHPGPLPHRPEKGRAAIGRTLDGAEAASASALDLLEMELEALSQQSPRLGPDEALARAAVVLQHLEGEGARLRLRLSLIAGEPVLDPPGFPAEWRPAYQARGRTVESPVRSRLKRLEWLRGLATFHERITALRARWEPRAPGGRLERAAATLLRGASRAGGAILRRLLQLAPRPEQPRQGSERARRPPRWPGG